MGVGGLPFTISDTEDGSDVFSAQFGPQTESYGNPNWRRLGELRFEFLEPPRSLDVERKR